MRGLWLSLTANYGAFGSLRIGVIIFKGKGWGGWGCWWGGVALVIVGVYSVGFVVVGLEDGSQVGGSKAMGYKLGFLAP